MKCLKEQIEEIKDEIKEEIKEVNKEGNCPIREIMDNETITDLLPSGYRIYTLSKQVIKIGPNAFHNSSYDEIIMHENITSIGESAFLRSLIIRCRLPPLITKISTQTFMDCFRLTEVTISANVESIGTGAFMFCHQLEHVIFEEGSKLKKIDTYAFSNCIELKKIVLPEGLEIIEENAFNGCTNLTEVIIPQSVSIISDGAFYGCVYLKTLTLPRLFEDMEKDMELYFITECIISYY